MKYKHCKSLLRAFYTMGTDIAHTSYAYTQMDKHIYIEKHIYTDTYSACRQVYMSHESYFIMYL